MFEREWWYIVLAALKWVRSVQHRFITTRAMSPLLLRRVATPGLPHIDIRSFTQTDMFPSRNWNLDYNIFIDHYTVAEYFSWSISEFRTLPKTWKCHGQWKQWRGYWLGGLVNGRTPRTRLIQTQCWRDVRPTPPTAYPFASTMKNIKISQNRS